MRVVCSVDSCALKFVLFLIPTWSSNASWCPSVQSRVNCDLPRRALSSK